MFKNQYRIVRDRYLGYEAQIKYWWWPFWVVIDCNTFPSVEGAEEFARNHATRVVKHLGSFD